LARPADTRRTLAAAHAAGLSRHRVQRSARSVYCSAVGGALNVCRTERPHREFCIVVSAMFRAGFRNESAGLRRANGGTVLTIF
jgi:hypothetical protein